MGSRSVPLQRRDSAAGGTLALASSASRIFERGTANVGPLQLDGNGRLRFRGGRIESTQEERKERKLRDRIESTRRYEDLSVDKDNPSEETERLSVDELRDFELEHQVCLCLTFVE